MAHGKSVALPAGQREEKKSSSKRKQILPIALAQQHFAAEQKQMPKKTKSAGVAQLVERCLAKAKVAGSNPVFRSRKGLERSRFFNFANISSLGAGV